MEPEINDKYKGREAVAIVRYKEKYYLRLAMSTEQLSQMFIEERSSTFRYDIVKIYNEVNGEAYRILQDACMNLEKGKKVNLDSLLK